MAPDYESGPHDFPVILKKRRTTLDPMSRLALVARRIVDREVGCRPLHVVNVRLWPMADIASGAAHVRFWG
jgi:hypothetical protein